MTDCLIKPVKAEDIYSLIDRVCPDKLKALVNSDENNKSTESKVVDLEIALQTVGGDKDILREALNVFVEQDYPRLLAQLKTGMALGDSKEVKAAAHGIKGNARTFGGIRLGDIAQCLEEKGRTNELDGINELINNLEKEFMQFIEFFSISGIQSNPTQ
jgi:HPt (histidine-containing phosphotransfer) domain-containing protein